MSQTPSRFCHKTSASKPVHNRVEIRGEPDLLQLFHHVPVGLPVTTCSQGFSSCNSSLLPVQGVQGARQGWGGSPRLTHNEGEQKSRAQKPMPRTFAPQQDQKHQASTTALLNTIWMETGGPCLLLTIRMGVNNTAGPQDPGSLWRTWHSDSHPKPLLL